MLSFDNDRRREVMDELARRGISVGSYPVGLQRESRKMEIAAEMRRRGLYAAPSQQISEYASPHPSTISEHIDGGMAGMPDILPTQAPQFSPDELAAAVKTHFKTRGQSITDQEVASIVANNKDRPDRLLGMIDPEILSGRAASRLTGEAQLGYSYQNQAQRNEDLAAIAGVNQSNRNIRNQARGEQTAQMLGNMSLGPVLPAEVSRSVGAGFMAAADTASLGVPALIRGAVQPDTRGMEAQVAAAHPGATALGTVAGSFVPGAGGAKAGGAAAQLIARTRAPLGKSLARISGAAGGGFASMMPGSAVQTYNATGDIQQAEEAAKHVFGQYKDIAVKLAGDEDLELEDWVAIAQILPIELEVFQAIKAGIPVPKVTRDTIARDISKALNQDIDAAKLPGSEIEPGFQGVQSALENSDPAVRLTTEPNGPIPDFGVVRLREIQEQIKNPKLSRQEQVALGNEGVSIQARLEEGNQNPIDPAMASRTATTYGGIDVDVMSDPGKMPARPTGSIPSRLTSEGFAPEEQVVVDRAAERLMEMPEDQRSELVRQAKISNNPNAKFFLKGAEKLENARFKERSGQSIDVETEQSKYSTAAKNIKFRPGSFVHTTTLDVPTLKKMLSEGLQAGGQEGATGFDTGTFAEKIPDTGRIGRYWGRDKVPVFIEMPEGVQGFISKGGDYEIVTPGKSYVSSQDISKARVRVGTDPNVYSLADVIRRAESNEIKESTQKSRRAAPSVEPAMEKVLKHLESNPEAGPRELQRVLGLPYSTVRRALLRVREGTARFVVVETPKPVTPEPARAAPAPEPEPKANNDQAVIDSPESASHKDLRRVLGDLGLSTKGSTKALRDRLIEAREKSKAAPEAATQSDRSKDPEPQPKEDPPKKAQKIFKQPQRSQADLDNEGAMKMQAAIMRAASSNLEPAMVIKGWDINHAKTLLERQKAAPGYEATVLSAIAKAFPELHDQAMGILLDKRVANGQAPTVPFVRALLGDVSIKEANRFLKQWRSTNKVAVEPERFTEKPKKAEKISPPERKSPPPARQENVSPERRDELDALARSVPDNYRASDIDWTRDVTNEEWKYLYRRFGEHTSIGKKIRRFEDLAEDRGGEGDHGGSAAFSPVIPEPNTVPGTAVNAARAAAVNARQSRSITSPESPHKIIGRLLKKMGLAPAGLGGARILRRWAEGFIRIQPEAIRLRSADALGATIHEVGHYLHKLIFQGGITAMDRVPSGKRMSATGLKHGVFPKHWVPELESMGEALYGKRRPSAGYVAEGWAELIRNAFTGQTDRMYEVNGKQVKVADMASYREAMANLMANWPEQYNAMVEFRDAYLNFYGSTPRARLATYIQREMSKKPITERISDFLTTARTVWFDRARSLVMLKEDLGLSDLPADRDPEIVARRAIGRAGGDMRNALERGTFDPLHPENGFTGKSLRDILAPVSKHITHFEDYLLARRIIERRAKGFDGLATTITDAELAQIVGELEAQYPEFKKAAKEFYDFGEWTLEYAEKHGLITSEQRKLIGNGSEDYVTLRAIYDEASGNQNAVGASKRYTETGSGVRRFGRNNLGRQFSPPIESFIARTMGIFERAQNNRVGQALIDLFAGEADYATMSRWRLEEVAIENSIDPELPRQDIINALVSLGKRVSVSEGMGRWIDKIERPLLPSRVGAEDAQATINGRLKAAGIDPKDPTVQALVQLIASDDFLAFRPTNKVDTRTKQFTVLVNGKPTYWEAKNERLYNFIKGFENPTAIHGAMQWLSMPKRILRGGATTYNPAFPISNFIRDTVEAFVTGRLEPALSKGGLAGKAHFFGAKLAAYKKAFLEGDPGGMFMASGADMKGLFQEYYDPKSNRFDFKNLFEKPGLIDIRGETPGAKALDVALGMPVWRMIQKINERFELATRLAEFEGHLAAGDVERAADLVGGKATWSEIKAAKQLRTRADIEAAGQAASDVTLDFMRGGRYALETNKVTPFFNASLQGGAKLARYIRNDPLGFASRVIKWVVVPSVVQHLLNRKDKEYWNIPQEQRDRYWHFPVGDVAGDGFKRYLRIPKPYAIGAFALLAERGMAAFDGIDPSTGERGQRDPFKGFGNSVWLSFRPPVTVPMVTEALEIYTNKSFYTGAEIVRVGEQIGPKGEQGGERSSEFARTIGSFSNIPPPIIDHAVQGTFGGAGKEAVQYAIDPMLKVFRKNIMGYEERPSVRPKNTQMDGWPIIKNFIVSEPKTYTENLNRFREVFDDAEDIFRGVKSASMGKDGGDAYFQKHQAEIEAYHILVKYKKYIDSNFALLRDIYRNTEMSEDDRNKQTKEIYREIDSMASEGLREIYKPKGNKNEPR